MNKIFLFLFFAVVLLIPRKSVCQISISLEPNQTSGVAPISVIFDASETTSSATGSAFHELNYSWDFGDPGSGRFFTNEKSKNTASGPIVAHVYDTPGTYTVSLTVIDHMGASSTKEVAIEVTDPDDFYSGENTYCFSNTTNFDGAPDGAILVATTDFSDIEDHMADNKRYLFKRGDTFSSPVEADITANITGKNVLIGAFGESQGLNSFGLSVNPPLINATIKTSDYVCQATNIRIMDLKGIGSEVYDVDGFIQCSYGPHTLIYRCETENVGISVKNNRAGEPENFHSAHTDLTIADCYFHDAIGGYGRCILYLGAKRVAIMGSAFKNATQIEHCLRVFFMQDSYINSNIFTDPAQSKVCIKLHNNHDTSLETAPDYHQHSKRIVISDNFLFGKNSAWLMAVAPQNNNRDERVKDVIIERNDFKGSSKTTLAVRIAASDITIRNNIFRGETFLYDVWVEQMATEPTPENVKIYNNTFHSGGNEYMVFALFKEEANNCMGKNNLVYTPNYDRVYVVRDYGTTNQASNNLLFIDQDPLFINNSLDTTVHFKLKENSTAVNSGVNITGVYNDFSDRRRTDGLCDIGAFERLNLPPNATSNTISALEDASNVIGFADLG